MLSNEVNSLDLLIKILKDHGTWDTMQDALHIDMWNYSLDYNTAIQYLRRTLGSFMSLYKYCETKNHTFNSILNDSENERILELLKTQNILNIELAKQLLIAKIRENV